MKCKDCRHYNKKGRIIEGWGSCRNPKLDIDYGDIIHAGADDDCGSYWYMTGDFGCIFFERC